MPFDINKIIKKDLPPEQYIQEEHKKTQVFLHHTAGSSNPFNVLAGWKANKERIATAFIIAGKPKPGETKYKDGDIIQCFDEKFWAYHLGLKGDIFTKYGLKYKPLDKTSIGIEICNFGQLTKQSDGTFKNYVGGTIPTDEVIDLGTEYRGYCYYHAYTDSQINSVKELLIYLCDKYNIPTTYNEMFSVNQGCLNGAAGIWSHTSCRPDKRDISPQPKIITMLKNLVYGITGQLSAKK